MKIIENGEEIELYEIPGYKGYVASKKGDIYSCIQQGCRNRFNENKWLEEPIKLKYRMTTKGYARVYLRNDKTNKREDLYIHRIIASLFVDNPNNYDVVNHIDCNRANNNCNNLEWVSVKQNIDYAFEHGFMTRDSKGRFIHK